MVAFTGVVVCTPPTYEVTSTKTSIELTPSRWRTVMEMGIVLPVVGTVPETGQLPMLGGTGGQFTEGLRLLKLYDTL